MKNIALFGLLAGAAALAFTACGSSSDNNSPDGGTNAGDGGGGGGDGSSTSTTTAKLGHLIVEWKQSTASATGIFPKLGVAGCQESDVGPCHIEVCPNSTAGNGQLALGTAGTITVAGGSGPLTLEPAAETGIYAPKDGVDVPTFDTGTALTASSTGGDVPAFSGQIAKVPADITVSEDNLSTVDYSKDLDVTWTDGGSDGKVFVELGAASDNVGRVTCQFDPKAGKGTVPAAALAKLPACPSAGVCTWAVTPRSRDHFTAGDYAIDFDVNAGGSTGTYTN